MPGSLWPGCPFLCQMQETEDRRRKTEDRGQKTEDRRPKLRAIARSPESQRRFGNRRPKKRTNLLNPLNISTSQPSLLHPPMVLLQVKLTEGMKQVDIVFIKEHEPFHDAAVNKVIGLHIHIAKDLAGFFTNNG